MISIIHPSRSRPKKALETFNKWSDRSKSERYILSLDYDDPCLQEYLNIMPDEFKLWSDTHKQPSQNAYIVVGKNKSSVEAINNAARFAGGIFIVVSDDTEPCNNWHYEIESIARAQPYDAAWILKTYDGIQPWIITMPIMSEAYYNLFGYIYYPGYQHLFCDTELTCVADILGRKITSNLLFPHNHYSIGKATLDSVYSKNDRTNEQGEKLFLERYARNFDLPPGNKIQDLGLINWLKKRNRV